MVTRIKSGGDEEVTALRKKLTETKSPAELAQITSIADLPLPATLESFLKANRKSAKKREESAEEDNNEEKKR